ncbi:MAG TPA: hypothetical protein VHO06_22195 [Polyangia bacterium]|nr:hypothetical protein [Polyangia bacterium]
MKQASALLFAALAAVSSVSLSCGSSGGGSPSVTCTNGTIVADEANNYSFSSSLKLQMTKVQPSSNLTFSWGGVTKDFLGQPVTVSTDLNTILVLMVNLTLQDFETQIDDDTFFQSSLVITPPPNFTPTGGVTMATLYNDFSAGGEPVTADNASMYLDPTMYPPDQNTFILAAQTGANLGEDIRMMQAFQLDPSSTNTAVTLTNSSTTLDYTANLHALHPTGVPAGTAALTLDWSAMEDGEMNALGTAFAAGSITSAIVGHYTQTPAQLESQFLDLQTSAEDLYTAAIPYGSMLDFTTLTDQAGNSFPGIDSTGTWLVGLICGNCRNPAPWYLTILEPAPQPCK